MAKDASVLRGDVSYAQLLDHLRHHEATALETTVRRGRPAARRRLLLDIFLAKIRERMAPGGRLAALGAVYAAVAAPVASPQETPAAAPAETPAAAPAETPAAPPAETPAAPPAETPAVEPTAPADRRLHRWLLAQDPSPVVFNHHEVHRVLRAKFHSGAVYGRVVDRVECQPEYYDVSPRAVAALNARLLFEKYSPLLAVLLGEARAGDIARGKRHVPAAPGEKSPFCARMCVRAPLSDYERADDKGKLVRVYADVAVLVRDGPPGFRTCIPVAKPEGDAKARLAGSCVRVVSLAELARVADGYDIRVGDRRADAGAPPAPAAPPAPPAPPRLLVVRDPWSVGDALGEALCGVLGVKDDGRHLPHLLGELRGEQQARRDAAEGAGGSAAEGAGGSAAEGAGGSAAAPSLRAPDGAVLLAPELLRHRLRGALGLAEDDAVRRFIAGVVRFAEGGDRADFARAGADFAAFGRACLDTLAGVMGTLWDERRRQNYALLCRRAPGAFAELAALRGRLSEDSSETVRELGVLLALEDPAAPAVAAALAGLPRARAFCEAASRVLLDYYYAQKQLLLVLNHAHELALRRLVEARRDLVLVYPKRNLARLACLREEFARAAPDGALACFVPALSAPQLRAGWRAMALSGHHGRVEAYEVLRDSLVSFAFSAGTEGVCWLGARSAIERSEPTGAVKCPPLFAPLFEAFRDFSPKRWQGAAYFYSDSLEVNHRRLAAQNPGLVREVMDFFRPLENIGPVAAKKKAIVFFAPPGSGKSFLMTKYAHGYAIVQLDPLIADFPEYKRTVADLLVTRERYKSQLPEPILNTICIAAANACHSYYGVFIRIWQLGHVRALLQQGVNTAVEMAGGHVGPFEWVLAHARGGVDVYVPHSPFEDQYFNQIERAADELRWMRRDRLQFYSDRAYGQLELLAFKHRKRVRLHVYENSAEGLLKYGPGEACPPALQSEPGFYKLLSAFRICSLQKGERERAGAVRGGGCARRAAAHAVLCIALVVLALCALSTLWWPRAALELPRLPARVENEKGDVPSLVSAALPPEGA